MSHPTKSATPPQDFSDMNITDEDPIRPASPDRTMVSKGANNGGYHGAAEPQPKGLIVSRSPSSFRAIAHAYDEQTVQPLKKQE